MDRSEPTLVPEWLKSSASVTGGGSPNHQFSSSSLHSGNLHFFTFKLFYVYLFNYFLVSEKLEEEGRKLSLSPFFFFFQ